MSRVSHVRSTRSLVLSRSKAASRIASIVGVLTVLCNRQSLIKAIEQTAAHVPTPMAVRTTPPTPAPAPAIVPALPSELLAQFASGANLSTFDVGVLTRVLMIEGSKERVETTSLAARLGELQRRVCSELGQFCHIIAN